MSRPGASIVVALVGSAVIAAVGLCACGSTSNSGTVTNAASQVALARCMRSHGVPNFPDPFSGGGFSIGVTPGSSTVTIDGSTFAGPAFEAAVKTCKLFGGGAAPPALSASQKQKMVAFAECMRAHGVPDFPDPTFPSGGAIKRSFPTGVVPSSPAFQRASNACGRGAQ
jgi:hypothetical protein